MPTGMIAVFTEGTYGLRTEGSIASLQCPAQGFAPQPSPHTFICKTGIWETQGEYTFNGITLASGKKFIGEFASTFVNIGLTSMKGIWWNNAFAKGSSLTSIPLGWRGGYYCEGVNCPPTYRVPNSFNPNNPSNTLPNHPPLYGYLEW